MRKNFFGEHIATPNDDISEVKVHLDEREFTPMSADVFAEKDDICLYGGELRDEDGEAFNFDGFHSLEAAKVFARNFVPANEIQVVD